MPDPLIDLSGIAKKYPRLAPLAKDAVAQWGEDTGDGRQLEFYPSWEDQSPHPGKPVLEFYNRAMPADQLPDIAAADLLHQLGGVDPRTNTAVDPDWLAEKQKFLNTRTVKQMQTDQQEYAADRKAYPSNRSMTDWMDQSRGDAYLRGAIFPAQNPEWGDYLTDEQKQHGARLLQMLQGK